MYFILKCGKKQEVGGEEARGRERVGGERFKCERESSMVKKCKEN